jgi:hypothetical protein
MLSSFLLRKLLSLSEVIKISLHQAGERISSIFESEKIQVVSGSLLGSRSLFLLPDVAKG